MSKHRLSRRRRIAAAATALAAGGVLIVAQNDAPAAATDPVGLNSVYEYLGWGDSGDAQDPVEVMKATGIRQFTLAFLLANQGCEPAWDGTRRLTGSDEEAKIKAIRAAGGDVVASFGGWDGAKLGEKCTDAAQLAAAYQKVIDAYQLKAIDIDIESTELTGAESRHRVVDALKAVKAKNPGLRIYVTFSTEENGPDADGTDLITTAAKAGLEADGWVVMPFDFDRHQGTMVDATKSALTGLQQTLVKAYGYDQDTAWRHAGLSSINGHSDSPDEVVSPADFQAMRDFAAAHHLARFTFWAVNRDRACAGAFTADTASKCGGIQQSPYEFTKIVAGYHVDSTSSGTATHCPGPTVSPSPEVTVLTTASAPAEAETTAAARSGRPVGTLAPGPSASGSPTKLQTATEAKRGKTASPTASPDDSDDSGDTGDSGDSGDENTKPKNTAEPADPTQSAKPDKPKKGASKPTTASASPESGPPTATPSKHRTSPTATTSTAPVTPAQTPTTDCATTADPVVTPTTPTTPAGSPGATATSTSTGQPTTEPTPEPTAKPTTERPTQQPAPSRTATPAPTTQAPAPVVTPTATPTATATPSPTTKHTAPAAAPTTTAATDANGQPLASTGGGSATSVVVAGAGALLLIGGGFGMVGSRRRRAAEESN
ncbi:hypothetical protein ACFV0O_03880 [Kitasatospora sp. NPDC059577]|uniref:hypothetical protein n=1 Tax=Kitasatospora sp. NPDC059577 TaxID=3346873 RepID=UPI0036966CAC